MSNPGSPGEDERPLAGPGAGMGLPESGSQHATSTDVPLPVDPPIGDEPMGRTPPPAQPMPPAYEDPSELVTPGYPGPADPLTEATTGTLEETVGTPAYDALAAESGFVRESGGPAGGLLAKVRAFAEERPAAFLAAALVAGWLVGKLLSSDDDDDED